MPKVVTHRTPYSLSLFLLSCFLLLEELELQDYPSRGMAAVVLFDVKCILSLAPEMADMKRAVLADGSGAVGGARAGGVADDCAAFLRQ